MSASLEVILVWEGERALEECGEAIDYAIAYAMMDAVTLDKATTPVDQGNLQRSKTTHSPGYATNDFNAAQGGDLALSDVELVKRQVVDHALAEGSWIPYAYAVETGTSVMPARPSTVPACDAVAANMDHYLETGFDHIRRVI